LPAEILNSIALSVGQSHKHETWTGLVSPDLLRSRLICRSFNAAASYAFFKLAQKSKKRIESYSTLHLPNKKFDLDTLLSIFSSSSFSSKMIKTVVYNVLRGPAKPDMYDMEDMFDDPEMMGMSDDEDVWYEGKAERIVEYNMEVFKSQCKQQQDFAKSLETESQQEKLASLLNALPQLEKIGVLVENFWGGHVTHDWASEPDDVGCSAYQSGIPALLQALGKSSATSLELIGLGIFGLGGLYPSRVHRICHLSQALKNITTLHLEFSHMDSMRDDDYDMGEWDDRFTSLSRGDRVNHLLIFTENLERLTLSCHDDYPSKLDIDDGEWLQDICRDLKWKKLTHMTLKGFGFGYRAGATGIQDLLFNHKDVLRNLTITKCRQQASQWTLLIKFLRENLALRRASLKICSSDIKQMPSEYLNVVIREHGVSKQHEDVDIGSYVSKSKLNAATGVEAIKSKVKTASTGANAAK